MKREWAFYAPNCVQEKPIHFHLTTKEREMIFEYVRKGVLVVSQNGLCVGHVTIGMLSIGSKSWRMHFYCSDHFVLNPPNFNPIWHKVANRAGTCKGNNFTILLGQNPTKYLEQFGRTKSGRGRYFQNLTGKIRHGFSARFSIWIWS